MSEQQQQTEAGKSQLTCLKVKKTVSEKQRLDPRAHVSEPVLILQDRTGAVVVAPFSYSHTYGE